MKLKQIIKLVSSYEDIQLIFKDESDRFVELKVDKSTIIHYHSHLLNYEVIGIESVYTVDKPCLLIRIK